MLLGSRCLSLWLDLKVACSSPCFHVSGFEGFYLPLSFILTFTSEVWVTSKPPLWKHDSARHRPHLYSVGAIQAWAANVSEVWLSLKIVFYVILIIISAYYLGPLLCCCTWCILFWLEVFPCLEKFTLCLWCACLGIHKETLLCCIEPAKWWSAHPWRGGASCFPRYSGENFAPALVATYLSITQLSFSKSKGRLPRHLVAEHKLKHLK